MDNSHPLDLLDYVREKGIVRSRDIEAIGIPRKYLSRAVEHGTIERIGRGLYMAADAEWTPFHTLAQSAAAVPRGVLCLVTALQFHGLTTELPREVWMALPPGSPPPRATALHVVRFSGAAFTAGIEQHLVEGVTMKVYSPAKTIVDCFKYRNKIGVDVAIEALRDWRRQRLSSEDELLRYAALCRMTNVMRPYLEAVS